MAQTTTGVIEGWKAIGEALGIDASSSAVRKRLHGWEIFEGLPVHRVRRRVFVTVIALQAWSAAFHPEQRVTLRRIK